MRAVRPDRVEASASKFISAVFNAPLVTEEDLQAIVDQCEATTPIALVSVPGHDAAFRVENLVTDPRDLISGQSLRRLCSLDQTADLPISFLQSRWEVPRVFALPSKPLLKRPEAARWSSSRTPTSSPAGFPRAWRSASRRFGLILVSASS